MKFFENKRKRRAFIWITSIFVVLLIIIIACAIYLNTYYKADLDAIEAFSPEIDIEQREEDNLTIFEPENANI